MTTDLMNTVKLKPTPEKRGPDVMDPLTGSFPTSPMVNALKWTAIRLKPTTTASKLEPKDEKGVTYNILNPGTNAMSDKLHMEDDHSSILRNTETSPRSITSLAYGMYNMGTIREEDWTQISH